MRRRSKVDTAGEKTGIDCQTRPQDLLRHPGRESTLERHEGDDEHDEARKRGEQNRDHGAACPLPAPFFVGGRWGRGARGHHRSLGPNIDPALVPPM